AELLSVLLTFVEVIQLFLYPTIPTLVIGLILMILVVYSVLGGIRVIVGVAFLFILATLWVFILLYDPITRMEIIHFHPMSEASATDILKGANATDYTFLGIEMLFLVYPFNENKKKAKLPVYVGLAGSALLVHVNTIISIGYYSPYDFNKM